MRSFPSENRFEALPYLCPFLRKWSLFLVCRVLFGYGIPFVVKPLEVPI